MPRNYWSPLMREALHQGQVTVDQDDLVASYREWKSTDVVLTFQKEGEEDIEVVGAKRGNRPYAIKKWKKWKQLHGGMDLLKWDHEIPNSRKHVKRKTHLLFITPTFARDRSIQEAWRLCTSKGQALNIFSAKLYKILGNKAKFTVKEAQSSGYPAPHILCIIDRPVTAFKHNKYWRVQNRQIVQQIKQAWPYGHCDIQACVDGRIEGRGVMSYIMKYQTKTVDVDYLSPKQLNIAELTHSWNKIYGMRDVVSKQFAQRLNTLHVEPVEDEGPSGWELASIERFPDLIMTAQRAGIGVPATGELRLAG